MTNNTNIKICHKQINSTVYLVDKISEKLIMQREQIKSSNKQVNDIELTSNESLKRVKIINSTFYSWWYWLVDIGNTIKDSLYNKNDNIIIDHLDNNMVNVQKYCTSKIINKSGNNASSIYNASNHSNHSNKTDEISELEALSNELENLQNISLGINIELGEQCELYKKINGKNNDNNKRLKDINFITSKKK